MFARLAPHPLWPAMPAVPAKIREGAGCADSHNSSSRYSLDGSGEYRYAVDPSEGDRANAVLCVSGGVTRAENGEFYPRPNNEGKRA
jgi:hypothetical protein